MSDANQLREILLAKGNLYRTKIEVDEGYVTLTQRRLIPAICVGALAALGYSASPWIGIPLAVAACFVLVWRESFRISLTQDQVRVLSGPRPLQRCLIGTRANISHVEHREVVMQRSTGGTQSFGRWRTWDVNIHGFDGKVNFSVWEEGDESKTRAVAEALASILQCEVRHTSPNNAGGQRDEIGI